MNFKGFKIPHFKVGWQGKKCSGQTTLPTKKWTGGWRGCPQAWERSLLGQGFCAKMNDLVERKNETREPEGGNEERMFWGEKRGRAWGRGTNGPDELTGRKDLVNEAGRKAKSNLDCILKSRDISLLTKVHLVKAMIFPVVMHGCESWTIKNCYCC